MVNWRLLSAGPVILAVCILLPACAAPEPYLEGDAYAGEKSAVDSLFLRVRQNIQARQADSLLFDLSRETLTWLDDMRYAARSEPLSFLKDRPFYEIVAVLALRIERRENPAFEMTPLAIAEKVMVQTTPIRKSLLWGSLGPVKIRGNSGELGFKESENVPVFFFVKEAGRWKFNLVKSLPLILQGAESLARRRKPTPLEQAIFSLEAFTGKKVLVEDLK